MKLTVEYLKVFPVLYNIQWASQEKSEMWFRPSRSSVKRQKSHCIKFTSETSLGHLISFSDYLVYHPRGATELLGTVRMETKSNLYIDHMIANEFKVAVAVRIHTFI